MFWVLGSGSMARILTPKSEHPGMNDTLRFPKAIPAASRSTSNLGLGLGLKA